MKLRKGLTFSKAGDQKQNTILVVVLIVVILGAGFFFVRNFIGGGAPPAPAAGPTPPGGPIPGEEALGGLPPQEQAQPGQVPPAPPGAVSQPESSTPAQPPAAPATQPETKPAAPPSAPPAQPTAAAPREAKLEMRQIKVFGSVTINYPASWKIAAGAGNTSAVFTNGDASFAVHAPDPKADSAAKIAQTALKSLLPGAVVIAQGTDRVSGFEAQWLAVKFKGKTARVVGIDGPTRIALVQTVKSGNFSKYRDTFNKMQSEIRF